MMIVITFSMLFVSTFSMEHHLSIDLENSQVFGKIIQDVIAKTIVHDTAILISDFSLKKNFIIDSIIKLTMDNNVPMNCMASNISSARNLWSACRITSATLLLYIYKSKDLSNFMKVQDITDITLHGKSRPKLLLLAILEEANADFQALLRYMWTKYILNVAVLEMSKTNGSHTFIVHQYNPFSKKYSIQPYSQSVDWFPNKLRNLYGYPIKMDRISRPGYNTIDAIEKNHRQRQMVQQQGYDYRALITLKSVMNFSEVTNTNEDYIQTFRKNGTLQALLNGVRYGHVDTFFTTLPLGLLDGDEGDMAESFTFENWCVLMPVLYKKSNFEYDRMLRIIISLIIFTIFWLTTIILRFKSDSWRMLNIFGMIISFSISNFKLVPLSERILFVSVVAVSTIYSSNLFADLTTTNVGGQEEIQVENFRDLLRYNLTPVFGKAVFNNSFKNGQGDFLELKSSAITMGTTYECSEYLVEHGNVSCFMESKKAMTIVAMQKCIGKREITVNEKLCYWSPRNGYYFYKYSPYISRVGDILLCSQQVGLSQKWFTEYFDNISPGYLAQATKKRKEDYGKMAGTKLKIFIVVTCGYVVSILVFFGELIVHRLQSHRMLYWH